MITPLLDYLPEEERKEASKHEFVLYIPPVNNGDISNATIVGFGRSNSGLAKEMESVLVMARRLELKDKKKSIYIQKRLENYMKSVKLC